MINIDLLDASGPTDFSNATDPFLDSFDSFLNPFKAAILHRMRVKTRGIHREKSPRVHPLRQYLTRTPASTLDPDVADLVARIYARGRADWEAHLTAPFGQLSSMQIDQAGVMLDAIRFALSHKQTLALAPLNRKYVSLLSRRIDSPSDEFAIPCSPCYPINTVRRADEEQEILQRMADLASIQTTVLADTAGNDVAGQYAALGARLCPLMPGEAAYDRICEQIRTSHSWRHAFALNVRRIFAVTLPAERARFQTQGERLGNIHTLFHGAHASDLPGILSHGLRPSTRSAPCVAAPFGKGIHFTDESSTAAMASGLQQKGIGSCGTGYLLLADVALGTPKREILSCYRTAAPTGYDSVQSVKSRCLPHSAYVIYSPSLCTLRYIVEVAAN